MRAWPVALILVLLGLLSWVLWLNPEANPIEVPGDSSETQTENRDEASVVAKQVESTGAQVNPDAIEVEAPARDQREQLHEELEVRGSVLGMLAEPVFARLVYVSRGEMDAADWFHHPGMAWTKPKPVEADGSFAFRGAYTDSFANQDWRVEIGIAAQQNDEARGSTPLLTVGWSGSFAIERGIPVELPAIEVFEAIELVVPLHDWHLIPSDSAIQLEGEFERPPAFWTGQPIAAFKPSEGARLTKSIRLSPWHAGRKFRVKAASGNLKLDEPAYGEWITLQPGRHELSALHPVAGGMLEIFFPESRSLFPEKEGGSGFTDQTQIRLARFDAKRRTSFEARFLVDPGASKELYDSSWGLAPDPGGAWQGDTYIARVGWIESGAWSLAVEVAHLGRVAEPVSIEIAPFDVTRVTMRWLEPGTKIRILPSPAGLSMDDYVLSTWATLPNGKAHVYRFGLVEQSPRELQVPPGTRTISSVSHWHGEPKVVGGPSSRLSFYRGELSELRKPSAVQDDQAAQALPELAIHRANTSLVLEFPLDTSIKGYHMGEIRGLSGQLDQHAITFTVNPGRAIELVGFPPGYYDVRLAPNEPLVSATEFLPWRTIQIQAAAASDAATESNSPDSGKDRE